MLHYDVKGCLRDIKPFLGVVPSNLFRLLCSKVFGEVVQVFVTLTNGSFIVSHMLRSLILKCLAKCKALASSQLATIGCDAGCLDLDWYFL